MGRSNRGIPSVTEVNVRGDERRHAVSQSGSVSMVTYSLNSLLQQGKILFYDIRPAELIQLHIVSAYPAMDEIRQFLS
jgi:hypothetical protein